MTNHVKPELTHFALRNTTIAHLTKEAEATKATDPVKSAMLNSIIKNVQARPGFKPDHALSISGHFGLHKMPQHGQAANLAG